MNISFECVQCEADFELEMSDLLRDSTLVKCPNCGVKADASAVENTMSILEDLLVQMVRLGRRFRVGLCIEPDELEDELEDYECGEEENPALWSDEPEEDESDE